MNPEVNFKNLIACSPIGQKAERKDKKRKGKGKRSPLLLGVNSRAHWQDLVQIPLPGLQGHFQVHNTLPWPLPLNSWYQRHLGPEGDTGGGQKLTFHLFCDSFHIHPQRFSHFYLLAKIQRTFGELARVIQVFGT